MSVRYSRNAITEWDAVKGKFIIYKPFVCEWKRPFKPVFEFEIEEGFETDFASIPRWAQSIVPVIGKHIQPAITHDKTYEALIQSLAGQLMTKLESDTLFLEGMVYMTVNFARRNVMYRSVRVGGTGRWKD